MPGCSETTCRASNLNNTMAPPNLGGPRAGPSWCALVAAMACTAALAQTDEFDALSLADAPAPPPPPARDWQGFIDVSADHARNPAGERSVRRRLSLDLQLDKPLAPGWRAVMANRLDLHWPRQSGEAHHINTLKEGYVSWQPDPALALDFGRINARMGVATGYSPTDYFRTGSLRSQVSADPNDLKKNRQGSIMLRGQTLWAGGALGAVLSPRLAAPSSEASFALDEGATNASRRWLLSWSQRINDRLNPQWLLFGEDQRAPQIGFNLTALMSDAAVAFVEWSGGRGPTQLAQARGRAEERRWYQRVSAGATYTSAHKLTLTLEYSRNGAAPGAQEWRALQNGPALDYARYRRWVYTAQELTTRGLVALYASWPDALVRHLDFSAMARINIDDGSRLHWFEARYHWNPFDLALQWQGASGGARSDLDAPAQSRIWQVSLRHYF